MRSLLANEDFRLQLWRHVREFAVPPVMIEAATARRAVGDWAGACAVARVDVDLNLRAVARLHGSELAARIRADLRHLAPDLLRWHLPRTAPDGLLRPGLTMSLARYDSGDPVVHLVVRTPPAWADAGQRISLTLWQRSSRGTPHPHPWPDPGFRLDLHRHLWDARRSAELRERAGDGSAADRWPAEAARLLAADGRAGDVVVRLGARRRFLVAPDGPPRPMPAGAGIAGRPLLPHAAAWLPPDVELLRAGLVAVAGLHPLVAAALVPGAVPGIGRGDPGPRIVECRGARHRIGLVGGVLVALDHDPAEVRREELLAALTGTPLPCLRAIDDAYRHPESLTDIRARLDHGDAAGALAAVEELLGPGAVLRAGALRDELETAADRRITHGLFRAGLAGRAPTAPDPERRRTRRAMRTHPRNALTG